MNSILDPKFKYVCAAKTSVAKTFARIRREQAEAKQSAQQPVRAVVTKIVQRSGK